MAKPSAPSSKDPRVTGRHEGFHVFVTLLNMSDEQQNACLAAIQRLDRTATMKKGVIACAVGEPNRNSRRRNTAVLDLRRRAVTLARTTVASMPAKADSAAPSVPTRPSPKAEPNRRVSPRRPAYQH